MTVKNNRNGQVSVTILDSVIISLTIDRLRIYENSFDIEYGCFCKEEKIIKFTLLIL
jgi:hypothetical protein